MARILIVDDDRASLKLMQHILQDAGHEVFPLMSATKVTDESFSVAPDLVITDIMMPGITGGAVYEKIRSELGPFIPVIVSSSTTLHIKGEQIDPLLEHCPKPITRGEMQERVQVLLDKACALKSAAAAEEQRTTSERP